ncbi:MAG: hypothetical protein FJ091_00810 [Deltaproteobacteria bacterium]|nr:hypothetical protein [Deltaproteobacteria bacterium]
MQEHATKFRLDRRLAARRGWIAQDQLDKELNTLPDVGDKGEIVESPQQPAGDAAPAEGGGE